MNPWGDPPPRRPQRADLARGSLNGRRAILVHTEGFSWDYRIASELFTDPLLGDTVIRICREADWYAWHDAAEDAATEWPRFSFLRHALMVYVEM